MTKTRSKLKTAGWILSFLLCLTMIVGLALFASAAEEDVPVTWEFDFNTGTLTISGSGAMADYSYGEQPWFTHKDSIKSVVIESGVTTIGDSAFSNCGSLTSVTIPESVTAIGHDAFYDCDSLTSVTIPTGVTSIGEWAFAQSGLTSVTIPEGVITIGNNAFYNCTSLTSVHYLGTEQSWSASVDVDVHCLGDCSWSANDDGTTHSTTCPEDDCDCKITVPHSFTSVSGNCTACGIVGGYCGASTNNRGAASVTWSFNSNTGKLTISGSGAMADYSNSTPPWFAHKDSIKSVVIERGVTTIGDSAFADCGDLTIVHYLGTDPDWKDTVGKTVHCLDGVTWVANDDGTTHSWICPEDGCNAVVKAEVHSFSAGNCTACGIVGGYCGASTNNRGAASVTWSFNSNTDTGTGTLTISGSGAMADYGAVHSYDAPPWDGYRSYTQSVVIESGVTTISDYAFYNYYRCTSVTIPEGVTSIGEWAFAQSGLTSVTIPGSVTAIGDYAFENYGSLTSVTILEGVTSIGDYAFYGSGLTSVTIPESVTSIGNSAFAGCGSLTKFLVDENNTAYTAIDGGLFTKDGTTLIQYPVGNTVAEYVIPAGVTTIGDTAFENCGSLTSVTIPEGVITIGNNAFYNCTSLTSVTISEGVTTIGTNAFRGCSSLTSVTIPEGVTSIGDYAFRGCSSLTSVTIPEGVITIGNDAFYGCDSLTSVHYLGTEPSWKDTVGKTVHCLGDCSWSANDDGTTHSLICPVTDCGCVITLLHSFENGKCTACEIIGGYCGASTNNGGAESVTWSFNSNTDTGTGTLTISGSGDMADYSDGEQPWYEHLSSIQTVVIESGVTTIGNYAFAWSNLTSVTISGSVTAIGEWAFFNCDSLESVTIPGSVTTIGEYAFCDCGNLTSVTMPEDATSIGDFAFANCMSLTSVTIPEGVTTIGTATFQHCDSLTSVTIPESVTSIGESAFSWSGLTSVTIPDSVTSIGDAAFYGCGSLTMFLVDENNTAYIAIDGVLFTKDGTTLIQYPINKTVAEYVIPAGVTTIGADAFYDCDSLTSVTIPGSVTAIGEYAFAGSGLTSVTIPDSVTSIGNYAFRGCSSLTSVTIPESVTTIGDSAFAWSGLTSVTILGSDITIGDSAFADCGDLTSVHYLGTEPSWENTVGVEVHSMSSAVTTQPTCTEKGVKTFTCQNDPAHTYTEEIAETGHTKEAVSEKAATCTEKGLTDGEKCSVCGEILTAQTEIEAIGHTNETVSGKAATCTEKGLTDGEKCSVCGEILTAQTEIEAKGHAYDNACDGDCNVCGEARTPADHADADENGVCDECGAELPKEGLSGGVIAGIAVGSVAVVGAGGFSIFWFVIKKKKLFDLFKPRNS